MAEEVIKKNLSVLEDVFNELNRYMCAILDDIYANDKVKDTFATNVLPPRIPKIKKSLASIETAYKDFNKMKHSYELKNRLEKLEPCSFAIYRLLIENLGAFLGELDTVLKLDILKEETKKRLPFVHY